MEFKRLVICVLKNKCPNCIEGNFFSSSAFSIKHFAEMNKKCEQCGFDFKQEPGFYFGASYVSYAMQVAVFLGLYFGMIVFYHLPITSFIIAAIVLQLFLLPIIFRASRLIWVSLFADFKKK